MIENQYEHHMALSSHKLIPCIYHHATAYMSYVLNWHENLEVLLVESGNGVVKYDGKDLSVVPGDIVIVSPGDMHGIYSPGGMRYYCIIISESFLKENGIDIDNYRFKNLVHSKETCQVYLEATNAVREHRDAPKELSVANLRKAILHLGIKLCSHHAVLKNNKSKVLTKSEEYIKKALTYIADNYTEALTLQDIARHSGITKYHMAREFKRLTGQTPFTYINTLRCKKAKSCISRGMSVTETAMECGFESVSYFSRTYKKITGESPSLGNRKEASK